MRRLSLVGVTLCLLVTVGCGEKAPVTPQGATGGTLLSAPAQSDAAATAVCASNRAVLSAQYSVVQSGASPEADTSFAGVVQRAATTCPSGGTYAWDGSTSKVKCSTHGE